MPALSELVLDAVDALGSGAHSVVAIRRHLVEELGQTQSSAWNQTIVDALAEAAEAGVLSKGGSGARFLCRYEATGARSSGAGAKKRKKGAATAAAAAPAASSDGASDAAKKPAARRGRKQPAAAEVNLVSDDSDADSESESEEEPPAKKAKKPAAKKAAPKGKAKGKAKKAPAAKKKGKGAKASTAEAPPAQTAEDDSGAVRWFWAVRLPVSRCSSHRLRVPPDGNAGGSGRQGQGEAEQMDRIRRLDRGEAGGALEQARPEGQEARPGHDRQ